MRTLLCALLLAAGCGAPAAPAVQLTISGSNAMPSPGASLTADAGVAKVMGSSLSLTADGEAAALSVVLDTPAAPMRIAIGDYHLSVELSLKSGGAPPAWGSTDGALLFQELGARYVVTFERVEMIPAAGGAAGAFFLDGSATFTP